MIAPRKTPCSQSNASCTSGTTVERRPPNSIASIGTPCGSSHSGAIAGILAAGVVKRAFGCAAGSPHSGVQSLPCQSIRCAGRLLRHPLPPDVAVVGLRAVGEDRVRADRRHRVRVGLLAGARRDAEEAGLRVDRVQPAVVAELHPGDVVADRLDLPARDRGDQHREVGLAARARERRGDVLDVALGRGDLRISMCSASQPSSRAITEAIRSAKHFLPSSALPP